MSILAPAKDPNSIEPYYFVWCDLKTGLNDGSADDNGELQGATVSSYTVTVPDGITRDSDSRNSAALTLRGIEYPSNTVVTVWLSGGTVDQDYDILCHVVLSDARELDMTMRLPVRSH